MDERIGLSPGAEQNPLCVWAAERIAQSLGDPAAERDFSALRIAVVLAAPDQALSATLRFDHGQLTIHDGIVGIPDLTLCADRALLERLAELRFTPLLKPGERRRRWWHAAFPSLGAAGIAGWRQALLDTVGGQLKIYGLFSHARALVRTLRLLSRPNES